MDLAELGIVYISEGADAAIAKSQEYRDAAIAVIKTEDERVKASEKVIASTEALSAQITRSILGYQKSQAAIYEFNSIVIGANEALAEQIAQLKLLEQHEQLATQTARELSKEHRAEQGYLQDLAKDIQHLNKVREKEAADAETARQKELASREAYYSGIIAKAKAAEQQVTDTRHKAILDQQTATSRAAAMYIKEEQDRVKAAEKSAAEIAAVAKKSANTALKEAERKAMSEISWASKSRDEQIRIKEQIAAYKAAGVSDNTVVSTFGPAAISGTIREVDTLAEKWNKVTLNTSRARSEMVVIAHEAIQGRFSRIPASMMVFAEYSDITALALSGVGLAIMGLVASFAVVSIAMVKGILEQKELQNALIITGNFAGTTEDKLNQSAHAIVRFGGSIGTAKDVILQLASSGKFTAEMIDVVTASIVHMEHATGAGDDSVKTLVNEFKSLQAEANAHSRYSDEVTKAVLKLDAQYHFLTTSVLAQIRAFEDEGKVKEASTLATNEYAKVTESRAQEIVANLGSIERGYRAIKAAIGDTWSAMKDLGKTENAHTRLLLAAKEKAVNEQGEKSRAQSEANRALADIDIESNQMKVDKLDKLSVALEKYRNNLDKLRAGSQDNNTLAQLQPDVIAAHEAALAEKYRDKRIKAIKENSMVALNELVKEEDIRFATASQNADRMLTLEKQAFTASMQIENDRFAMKRSTNAKETALGLTTAKEYAEHYDIIVKAAEKSALEQKAIKARELMDGATYTANVIALEQAQKRNTERGQEEKIANIAKANAKQIALMEKLTGEVIAIDEQMNNTTAKAHSETLKMENAELDKSIGAITSKIAKEEAHLRTLTMTKEEIALRASVEDEAFGKLLENMLAEAQAQEVTLAGDKAKVEIYTLQIAKLKTLIDLRGKSQKVDENTAIAQKALDEAKKVEAEWKKGWEATNQVGMDVFVAWGLNGENMAKKIGDMLKKALLEAVYAATLKPIMFNIYTSVMGAGGATGAGVAAGVGAGANGALGGALSGVTSIASQMGLGMSSAMSNGFISGFGANMEMMATAVENGMFSTAAGISLPYVGAALAGLSVLKNLGVFGSNFTSATGTGNAFRRYDATGTSNYQVGNEGTQAQIDAAYASVDGLAKAYFDTASSLGIKAVEAGFAFGTNTGREGVNPNTVIGSSTNPQNVYSSGEISSGNAAEIQLAASRAVFFALQASELPDYLSGVFTSITASTATQDQITTALSFAQSLKTVRDALLETRTPLQILQDTVATGFTSLGTSAETFKTDFVAAIDGGLSADNLAKWQGLQSSMTSLAATAATVSDTMRSLTQANANLSDQWDKLTLSQDAYRAKTIAGYTEQEQAQARANYAIEDSIAAYNAQATANQQAADAAATLAAQVIADAQAKAAAIMSERQGLQDQYDTLTMTSAQLLDKQRNALDASNQALFDQVQSATDAKKAADDLAAAQTALAATNKGLQDQLDVLTGAQTDRSIALRDALDDSTRALMRQVYAQQDLKTATTDYLATAKVGATDAMSALTRSVDAQKKSIQLTITAAQEQVAATKGVFNAASAAVKELYSSVDSTAQFQADKARAFISQALAEAQATGRLPNNQQLSDAIAAAKGDTKEFASQVDADFAKLALAGNLSQLETLSKGQLTSAELALKAAEDQVTALDGILAAEQAQLDAFNNNSTALLSVADALVAFTASISTLNRATAASGGSAGGFSVQTAKATQSYYADTIKTIANTPSFSADNKAEWYKSMVSTGFTDDAIRTMVEAAVGPQTSQDWSYLKTLASYDVGTNFVPKTGPYTLHGGEEVTPRPYVDMQRSARDETNELLVRLITRVEALQVPLANIDTSTAKHVDLFDNVSAGGNAVITSS